MSISQVGHRSIPVRQSSNVVSQIQSSSIPQLKRTSGLVDSLPSKLTYKYWRALLSDSSPFAIKEVPPPKTSSQASISTFVWGALGLSVIAFMAILIHKTSSRSLAPSSRPHSRESNEERLQPGKKGGLVRGRKASFSATSPSGKSGAKTSGGSSGSAQKITMRFKQDRDQPFRVTRDNPLSENNCIVCSFKNILHYFNYSEAEIQDVLKNLRLNIHKDPNNLYEPDRDSERVELNYQFLLDHLKVLGMKESGYTKKGQAHEIKKAIDARKPIWIVSSEKTKHTLAVNVKSAAAVDKKRHALTDAHSYIIVPLEGSQNEYLVWDSLAGETKLTADVLKSNIDAMPDENLDVYHVIDRN